MLLPASHPKYENAVNMTDSPNEASSLLFTKATMSTHTVSTRKRNQDTKEELQALPSDESSEEEGSREDDSEESDAFDMDEDEEALLDLTPPTSEETAPPKAAFK